MYTHLHSAHLTSAFVTDTPTYPRWLKLRHTLSLCSTAQGWSPNIRSESAMLDLGMTHKRDFAKKCHDGMLQLVEFGKVDTSRTAALRGLLDDLALSD